MRDALEPTVVHVEDENLAMLVAFVDEIYGHTVAAQAGARLAAAPAIAQAVNAFAKSSPERVASVKEKIERYRAALAAEGLDDSIVRASHERPTLGQSVALLAGLPFALWGIVHHWLPYQLPRLVTHAFVKDETMVSTVKIITGTVAFTGLYVGEGFAWAHFLGDLPGVIIALTLPVTGVIALDVIEAWKARARRRRRRALRARTDPAKLHELESLRASIVAELDRARAEFLLARNEPLPEEGLA